ncbi:lamin tail domain-containing protein, partial [bacterium]|nr:lamin tail domain-containing protein [bacterium]
PCTISVKIRNIGDETAAGFNFFGGYIQGSDTTIVASEPLPEISAGDSVWMEFELSLPAGTYTIYAAVDDTVGTNNQRTYEITITEPGEAPRIIITEIMFKPTTSSEEWIEIYNDDDSPVDLANWTIADASGSATLTTESFVVQPGEYAILCESDIADRFSCSALVAEGWRYLNNDGDSIRLYDSFGNLVDSAFYSASDSWENDVSAERDSLYADGGNANNWSACTDPAGSTPCADNSIWPLDYDLAIVGMSCEPFRPDPDEPFTVSVQIENVGTNTASGYSVSLYYDVDRSHSYTEGDTLIGTQSVPSLASGEETSAAFNLSLPYGMHSLVAVLSDTVRNNNEFNLVVQIGASIVITEIMFKPSANDHEWIEIYNASTEAIDLANWTIADPSYEGTITYESFVVEPNTYAIISQNPIGGLECPAVVAEGWPYLNNDGDEIFIKNAEGEVVDHAVYEVEGEWTEDVSAEKISINADGADPNNWKPSRALEGSTPCHDNSIWSATAEVTCDIQPNPFDPTMGEEAGISVNAPADATIEIRIYDLRGRLIQDFGNRAAVMWDGRDSDGDFVPAGPYIVVAQVDQNGKVSHHRFAIAVAYGMKK